MDLSSEKDGLDVKEDGAIVVVGELEMGCTADGRNEAYGLDCTRCCGCRVEDVCDEECGGESSMGMILELFLIGSCCCCGCGCCCC